MDIIKIEILEDGTAKCYTDEISPANHAGADELLDLLEKELGGKRTTEQKEGVLHKHKYQQKEKAKAF